MVFCRAACLCGRQASPYAAAESDIFDFLRRDQSYFPDVFKGTGFRGAFEAVFVTSKKAALTKVYFPPGFYLKVFFKYPLTKPVKMFIIVTGVCEKNNYLARSFEMDCRVVEHTGSKEGDKAGFNRFLIHSVLGSKTVKGVRK
ncbi:MAG: hypothetical protein AB1742_10130 [bacterium]